MSDHFIKRMFLNVLAAKRLPLTLIAPQLQPPINVKTLSRIIHNGHELSAPQHKAIVGFVAEHTGWPVGALHDFERDPLANRHRERLCLAMGELVHSENNHSLDLLKQVRAVYRSTKCMSVFDIGIPDDLWPSDQEVHPFLDELQEEVADKPKQFRPELEGTLLLSGLNAHARSNRPNGFGNQDDKDEEVEFLIDGVEHGQFKLAVVNDLFAPSFKGCAALLQPYQHVAIHDNRVMFLRLRSSAAVMFVSDESSEGAAAIRNIRWAISQLRQNLAHSPDQDSVLRLLRSLLSPNSWRTNLELWKRGRRLDPGA